MTTLTRQSDRFYAQLSGVFTGAQATAAVEEYAAKGVHATKHFSHEGDFGFVEYFIICPNKKDLAKLVGQDTLNSAYVNGSLLP